MEPGSDQWDERNTKTTRLEQAGDSIKMQMIGPEHLEEPVEVEAAPSETVIPRRFRITTDMLAAYGHSQRGALVTGTRDPGSQERGTIPMPAGGELQKPSAQTILKEVPDSRSVCPVPRFV